MADPMIQDATGAQAAAKRHLEGQHGPKLKDVKFNRAWYTPGSTMDVWEVEGLATIQQSLFQKQSRPFKFQIHPQTGRVIAFEG